jgi:polyisoprenoid-binding protein YceI
MSASATTSPFIGTYSADPTTPSVGFAPRHMSVATLRGSFADIEASGDVTGDGSLSPSGIAQVRSISIVSPPEFRNHVLGADFLGRRSSPGDRVRSGARRPR